MLMHMLINKPLYSSQQLYDLDSNLIIQNILGRLQSKLKFMCLSIFNRYKIFTCFCLFLCNMVLFVCLFCQTSNTENFRNYLRLSVCLFPKALI